LAGGKKIGGPVVLCRGKGAAKKTLNGSLEQALGSKREKGRTARYKNFVKSHAGGDL